MTTIIKRDPKEDPLFPCLLIDIEMGNKILLATAMKGSILTGIIMSDNSCEHIIGDWSDDFISYDWEPFHGSLTITS